MTNLPASEESFLRIEPQCALRLSEIFAGKGESTISSLACVCVSVSLLRHSSSRIHRVHLYGNDGGLEESFWKQNQGYDDILTHIFRVLPEHLRLPRGIKDVNMVFANLCIHASTIFVHQDPISRGEKCRTLDWHLMGINHHCLSAASQIAAIARMLSDLDMLKVYSALFPWTHNEANHHQHNIFVPFPLFLAARVCVQHLKYPPDDSTIKSSLHFLVSVLNILKSRNPLSAMLLSRLYPLNVAASR
jgi:hypothetical protein